MQAAGGGVVVLGSRLRANQQDALQQFWINEMLLQLVRPSCLAAQLPAAQHHSYCSAQAKLNQYQAFLPVMLRTLPHGPFLIPWPGSQPQSPCMPQHAKGSSCCPALPAEHQDLKALQCTMHCGRSWGAYHSAGQHTS